MKISSDKTRQQDCISNLKDIRVKMLAMLIVGTLNINFSTSKFDEFKLVVSGIFDILIITDKIKQHVLLSNFTLKVFQCHVG